MMIILLALLILLYPGISAGGKSLMLSASTFTLLSKATSPTDGHGEQNNIATNDDKRADAIINKILLEIERAESIDDVFHSSESIPAIALCVDKALRITDSTINDAEIAIHAVHKLLRIANSRGYNPEQFLKLNHDRRFEQLLECAESQLSQVSPAALARFMWSLSLYKNGNDQLIRRTILELSNRIDSWDSRLRLGDPLVTRLPSCDELATLSWVTGCIKESHEIYNASSGHRLADILEQTIANDPLRLETLRPSLLLRILWSHALQKISQPSLHERLISRMNLNINDLSSEKLISLIWAGSSLKIRRIDLFRVQLTLLNDRLLSHDYIESDPNAVFIALREFHAMVKPLLRGFRNAEDKESLHVFDLFAQCVIAVIDRSAEHIATFPFATTIAAVDLLTVIDADRPSAKMFWLYILSRLETEFKSNSDQVSIPEAIILLTGISKSLRGIRSAHLGREGDLEDAQKHPFHESHFHSWNYILGRLGARCAIKSSSLKEKIGLLDACWSLAALGFPYRLLIRAVRRSVQLSLHELSADNLAQLIVCLATEETQSGGRNRFVHYKRGSTARLSWSNSKISAKLDREFEDQVVIGIFRRAAEISTVESQVDALVAAAALGRMVSYRSSFSSYISVVNISRSELSQLETYRLIQLLWAHGRLPEGLVSANTIDSLNDLLSQRGLQPEIDDEISYDDLSLFIKNIVDDHHLLVSGKKKSLHPNALKACRSVVESLNDYFDNSDHLTLFGQNSADKLNEMALTPDISNQDPLPSKLEHALRLESSNLAYLSDMLEAFYQLSWLDDDVSRICTKAKQKYGDVPTTACGDVEGSSCSALLENIFINGLHVHLATRSFYLGKFDELTAAYRSLSAQSMTTKGEKYQLGKELLSKYL